MAGTTLGETTELLKALGVLAGAVGFGAPAVFLMRSLTRQLDRRPVKWIRGPGFSMAFDDERGGHDDPPVFVYLSPDQVGAPEATTGLGSTAGVPKQTQVQPIVDAVAGLYQERCFSGRPGLEARHRREWPELWAALDDLFAALRAHTGDQPPDSRPPTSMS